MSTLLIKFDSPLQSWGTTLKLKDHTTDRYPSKSAVIGMIASAMGRNRNDDVSDLANIKFGTRIDRQGTLIRDFQVSEISDEDKKIGHREYLSDACFTCGIEAEKTTLEYIESALLHPAYPLFAGRRGCPVTAELVQGIVDTELRETLNSYDLKGGHRTIVLDSDTGAGTMVKDIPVSFSSENRQYKYRFVEYL